MKIGITERGDAALDTSWKDRLDEVDGAIVITKNPRKLISNSLSLLMSYPVVVHCTITGNGGLIIEPNVIHPTIALDCAALLVEKLGSERVVVRIDPILWYPHNRLAMRVYKGARKRNISRVRISFIDLYPHVRNRMSVPAEYNEFHLPIEYRMRVFNDMDKPEVCAEPGLPCSGCISLRDIQAMGLENKLSGRLSKQRPACMCIAEKTELLTTKKQCYHGCLYCYWK